MISKLRFKLATAFFLLSMNFIQAQESVTLRSLGENSAQKQWEVTVPVKLKHLTFNLAILRDGIATYSREKRALLVYGFDGDLKWEKVTSEYLGAQISASPDGGYLAVCYAIGEDVPEVVIYNSHGEVIRQPDFCTRHFSASSRYLIGGGHRPMVMSVETGEILWDKREEKGYINWNAIPTVEDKLVVRAGGFLELFDLPTGSRFWRKEISIDGRYAPMGYTRVAPNDSLITLQVVAFDNINKNCTFVYNMAGDLLHQHERPVKVDETNGGIIQAISENGKYLAISDLQEFYMCTAETFERLWTLSERIIPREVQYFGKGVLAFKANFEWAKTRVFVLNELGQIARDYDFGQILDFQTVARFPELVKQDNTGDVHRESTWDTSVIPVMQIEERSEGVKFSLYRLLSSSLHR